MNTIIFSFNYKKLKIINIKDCLTMIKHLNYLFSASLRVPSGAYVFENLSSKVGKSALIFSTEKILDSLSSGNKVTVIALACLVVVQSDAQPTSGPTKIDAFN